jgi:Stage II sporulation protein E (SpoIIE)
MATEPKTILLVRRPGASVPDFTAHGYVVVERDLGAVPSVEFDGIDTVVVVTDPIDSAIAETRRLRVDLGDRYLPVYWLAPTDTASAFAAGADAVLAEPFVESLAIQSIAGQRIRQQFDGLRVRAEGVNATHELMGKMKASHRSNIDLVRETFQLCNSRPPERYGEFAIAIGIDDVRSDKADTVAIDSVEFGPILRTVAVRAGGQYVPGTATALLVRHIAIASREEPGECLRRINRILMERMTRFYFASAAILDLHRDSGQFHLAQSGLPNAMVVRGGGVDEPLVFGESQLGVYDDVFPTRTGRLEPDDALRVGERPTLYVEVRRDHLP